MERLDAVQQVTVFDRDVDLMNPEGLPGRAHLPSDKIASLGDLLINNSALSERDHRFAFESTRAVLRPGGMLLRAIQENPLAPWRKGTGQ